MSLKWSGANLCAALGMAVLSGGMALASPSAGAGGSDEGKNPCKTIESACESAGFARHASDKNLWKDCMSPILSGQAVAGVKVDAKDVQSCEARQAEKKAQHQGKQQPNAQPDTEKQ